MPDFLKAYQKIEEVWEDLPPVKKRRRRKRGILVLKIFSHFLFALLVFLIIFSFWAFSQFKSVYAWADQGKREARQALESLADREFGQAIVQARQAKNNFIKVDKEISAWKDSPWFLQLPALNTQLEDLHNLSQTALILNKSLEKGARIGEKFEKYLSPEKELKLSRLSSEEKQEILKLAYESQPEFRGIKANLELAIWQLENLKFYPWLGSLESRIGELKSELESLNGLAEEISDIYYLLPKLAGYPEASQFLVMFQNSNELRPTGGFLGTYGILEVENGEIKRFDTHDIYHLDMPVREKLNITPPEPLRKHLNKQWFLRDANWSPDWPTAAEKINWFYHKENNLLPPQNQINNFSGEFEGIIGITPQLVEDILEITGPVEVEGQQYRAENFLDLLQFEVQRGYQGERPSWERKEVIGKILTELKIKFFDLPLSRGEQIYSVFQKNVARRDFLIYFRDDYYQSLVRNLGWTGEVKETESDYLMLVDANLGALKTDSVINRQVSYKLEEKPSSLRVNLKVRYSHNGSLSWKVSPYRSYTRILVPTGSRLLSFKGHNVSFPAEETLQKREELGKDSWGIFFRLEPGEIGSLEYSYQLPSELYKKFKQKEQYNLYLQKQPGSRIESVRVDIRLLDKLKSYNPVGFHAQETEEGKGISWETGFEQDKKFQVKTP